MIKISLKKVVAAVLGLLVLYLLGTVLFFNATPKQKRITEPIQTGYSVTGPEFKRISGLIAGRQWVDGNSIEVLQRGQDVFAAMLDDISSAEKSITKETFVYFGDEVAAPFAKALAEAARNDVRVHFLMDFVGSVLASGEILDTMRDAGVNIERWREPSWYQLARFNHRTHRKLLVVDGRAAYTGGVNTADPWMPDLDEGGYKDYHFRLTGPIVNEIQGAFSENWVSSRGELLTGERYYPEPDTTGTLTMQVTSSHPREGQKRVRKMLLHAIASADESIRIGSAYFFPDAKFIQALVDAAERGISVTILTPGEKIDQNYVRRASHTLWDDLLKAGIRMYEYQPTMYHAKIMIVDDYFVTIGSTNFDNRSFRLNDEANINILDRDFGLKMAGYFGEDLDQSVQITLEDLKNRSLWHKFHGWLVAGTIGSYL
jgi:cardiolipin synthase A/B